MSKILYLPVGVPGSGKTTWADEFSRLNGCRVINPDRLRLLYTGNEGDISRDGDVWDYAMYLLIDLSMKGEDIIFDATNYRYKNRKRIIKVARIYGYKVVAYVFTTGLETAKIQNRGRSRVVPEEVIDRMYKGLQIPTLDEVDEVRYVTENEIKVERPEDILYV